MDECQKTIRQFLDRDLEHWRGLAEECRESELETWLELNPGHGLTRRGTDYVTYQFRSLVQPGFKEGVFFYFAEEQLRFMGTEFWSFAAEACAQLLRSLGEPSHRLDFQWRNMKFADAEMVYSDRGLSLGVIPETQVIASVMVFPPCTIDVYLARYRNITPTREFE